MKTSFRKTKKEDTERIRPVVSFVDTLDEQPVSEPTTSEPIAEDQSPPPENDQPVNFSQESPLNFSAKKSSGKTLVVALAFIGGLLLGSLIAGGVFYYFNSRQADQKSPSAPTPTDAVQTTPEPTATVSAKIDYSVFKVEVLNGSGVKGAAAAVEELITDLGFAEIEIGNAESDAEKTIVQLKREVPAAVAATLIELLDGYSAEQGNGLADSADHDILITVGPKQ